MAIKKILERIDHLSEKLCYDGWDSYSAKPLDKDFVLLVKNWIIRHAESLPRDCRGVFPTVSGAIQMEWHGNSKSIEIEFVKEPSQPQGVFVLLAIEEGAGREDVHTFDMTQDLSEILQTIFYWFISPERGFPSIL